MSLTAPVGAVSGRPVVTATPGSLGRGGGAGWKHKVTLTDAHDTKECAFMQYITELFIAPKLLGLLSLHRIVFLIFNSIYNYLLFSF